MRPYLALVVALISCLSFGQSTLPQTARQALIEMFFGQSPDHLEKHLPDLTRHSLSKFSSPGGENYLSEFSALAMQARAGGTNFQTFDTGPTLLLAEDPHPGARSEPDKIEITVERDDLVGDEDQIELALHLSRHGKEQSLPVIPRFTFAMQSESNVWRLNEISVTVRIPLADPNFLKTMEDQQRVRNEMMTMSMLRMVISAEANYSKAKARFACSLSALGSQYLYDPELIKGSKNGYNYVISGCDASHYKLVAEPASSDSQQPAFCSDESGDIRAASDGKATTCLSTGEPVREALPDLPTAVLTAPPAGEPAQNLAQSGAAAGIIAPASAGQNSAASASGSKATPQRVRVSQGVTQKMKISDVAPSYPSAAKQAGVQGSVVLAAVIGQDGSIQNLSVLNSPSPLLSQAALDAVRQWKYRPYLRNGSPVEVDTQITVNFTLSR